MVEVVLRHGLRVNIGSPILLKTFLFFKITFKVRDFSIEKFSNKHLLSLLLSPLCSDIN